MTGYVPVPPTDPKLRKAWKDGAAAEARCRAEGITEDNRQLFDFVETLAQMGRTQDSILWTTAVVFSANWSFVARLRLALRLVTRRFPR